VRRNEPIAETAVSEQTERHLATMIEDGSVKSAVESSVIEYPDDDGYWERSREDTDCGSHLGTFLRRTPEEFPSGNCDLAISGARAVPISAIARPYIRQADVGVTKAA
jgi:hypothetical protein